MSRFAVPSITEECMIDNETLCRIRVMILENINVSAFADQGKMGNGNPWLRLKTGRAEI